MIVTGLGSGPSEGYDSKRGRLKSTRVVCGYRCRLWYDGYSECHIHSANHVTAIRPVLHVFEISLVHHEDKKSEINGNFLMSVKSN